MYGIRDSLATADMMLGIAIKAVLYETSTNTYF